MNKFSIFRTNKFKRDYKKLSSKDKELVKKLIIKLANDEKLESKYKDHSLIGDYKGFRELHIKPDLLLIYKKDENELVLALIRVGSHFKLFK